MLHQREPRIGTCETSRSGEVHGIYCSNTGGPKDSCSTTNTLTDETFNGYIDGPHIDGVEESKKLLRKCDIAEHTKRNDTSYERRPALGSPPKFGVLALQQQGWQEPLLHLDHGDLPESKGTCVFDAKTPALLLAFWAHSSSSSKGGASVPKS